MLTSELRKKIGNRETATTIISLFLNCSKSEALIIKEIPEPIAVKCLQAARAYEKGVPIAYTAKKWFFCGLLMCVNSSVLVPRMDTEILVETVITEIKKQKGNRALAIADICTGSGCIAVALAKHFPNAGMTATDVSRAALSIARRNAVLNNANIVFKCGDLLAPLGGKKFDVIVSNPPYIKTSEIGMHDASVLNEPRIALDGGSDGLDFYRRIVADAKNQLVSDGLLALEIGHDQATAVKDLLRAGGYRDIKVVQDLNKLDRVITARYGVR